MHILLSAHVLFDGWLYKKQGKYVVGYSNKNSVLVHRVERLMKTYYKAPYKRLKPNGVWELELYSKRAFLNIKEDIARIYSGDLTCLEVLLTLRAFWDDEGGVSVDRKSVKLRARQKDFELLKSLASLHTKIGLNASIDRRSISVLIRKRDQIKRFFKILGFSPGIRVGGKGIFAGKRKDELAFLLNLT